MRKTTRSDSLGLGFALLILGAALIFGRPGNLAKLSDYTFANEPVEVVGFEQANVAVEDEPRKIVIPSLSIDLPVKHARVISGYWEVFENSAGWGEGSGVPGKPGNQVIFAHARPGLFLPLRKIDLGMRVYVLTGSSWFEYKVSEIKEVYPNQTEVIKPSVDERLTLYTCSGFADRKRLIVVANRV